MVDGGVAPEEQMRIAGSEISKPRIGTGRYRSGFGSGGRLLGAAIDDGEVLDDDRTSPSDSLDVPAGYGRRNAGVGHRRDPGRQPLGGAPKFIEPICTFSAPATPCTTPPVMLNWTLQPASPPTPRAFICSTS